MTFKTFSRAAFVLIATASMAVAAPAATARKPQPREPAKHDYPTSDRVSYVFTCMRDHPGNHHEMLSKCSCAIDEIAKELNADQYTASSTVSNAMSIGGERGGTLRDSEGVQVEVRKYRALQTKAKKACFVIP